MKQESDAPIMIIHFNPLERYPPVTNLLNFLGDNSKAPIVVVSTYNEEDSVLNDYKNAAENIIIKRTTHIHPNSASRLFNYFLFYSKCLFLLIKHQPKSVLYFESISSWAPLLYKKIRRHKVKLLAHYHEYVSKQEYRRDMRLVKSMHQMEIKMYPWAYNWISQTNEVRLEKFINDNRLEKIDQSVFHTMPNYPSKYWTKGKTVFNSANKIRLVYVGSLGYDTMYLQELTDWVRENKDFMSLDFYVYNIDEKANSFMQTINENCIRFHGGRNYNELPEILKRYDVGLIIYKPVSENWIHNAPNKVFEYLACGLDVWFSKTMTYTKTLERENVFPKIIAVDFEDLDAFDYQKVIKRDGLLHKEPDFFYEDVYGDICRCMEA